MPWQLRAHPGLIKFKYQGLIYNDRMILQEPQSDSRALVCWSESRIICATSQLNSVTQFVHIKASEEQHHQLQDCVCSLHCHRNFSRFVWFCCCFVVCVGLDFVVLCFVLVWGVFPSLWLIPNEIHQWFCCCITAPRAVKIYTPAAAFQGMKSTKEPLLRSSVHVGTNTSLQLISWKEALNPH